MRWAVVAMLERYVAERGGFRLQVGQGIARQA